MSEKPEIRYLVDEKSGERYRWDSSYPKYGSDTRAYPVKTAETAEEYQTKQDIAALEARQQKAAERRAIVRFLMIESLFVWMFFAGMTGVFVFGDTPLRLAEVACGLVVMLPGLLLAIGYPLYLGWTNIS